MASLYLLDDHPLIREGLQAVLEAAGHRVVGQSGDPAQALQQLPDLQPQVLLLDLDLDGRSGLDVLEQLQRRGIGVRTIALTMSLNAAQVARALALGAQGYVPKGAPAAELLTAIDVVLSGRRHLDPGMAKAARTARESSDEWLSGLALSPRERQIMFEVVRGRSSSEIGAKLGLSPKTVDSYRGRLMIKLGVADVPALVRWAIRNGLLDAAEP